MDRRAVNEILERMSPNDRMEAAAKESKLVYSVFGFLPVNDCTENSVLISNLAYLLSQNGLNTCILDFKVFYPNLYQYLDVVPNKRGRGLLNVLKNDRIDIRDEINVTKYERLFLLSPSPQDLMEEYFDFEVPQVERVIETLRKLFDIVLIDIPNIPPLEFCVAAMNCCHMGFITATERLDAVNNMTRILDFTSSLGISSAKFTSTIFMNVQDNGFDYSVIRNMNFKVVAMLPSVNGAITDSYEGRLYIRDNPLVNRYFAEQLENIAKAMINQI